MSQTSSSVEKSGKQSLAPPDERFWQRYSPHAELPLSGATSLALHFLALGLMLLSAWMAYALFNHASRSLPVEAVRLELGGGGGNRHGVGEGANRGSQPQEVSGEKNVEGAVAPNLDTQDVPKLEVQPATPQTMRFDDTAKRMIQQSRTSSSQAMQKLANANIRVQLPDRKPSGHGKGGTGEGGGDGKGKGTGTGDAHGPGQHAKLTQREKRMLRWSMIFDTRSGRDYFAQLKGLKAILAFPVGDDSNTANAQTNQYKVIRDLNARPAQPKSEDVSKLNRIYWIDDNAQSVRDIMGILGLKLRPKYFVAFMPENLEKRLFELERKYQQSHHNGDDEDNIVETKFRITRIGKKYVPVVIGQKVK